jgi:hypothetical protein
MTLTDGQIIAIRQATRAKNLNVPWADTLAFARAILSADPETAPRLPFVKLQPLTVPPLPVREAPPSPPRKRKPKRATGQVVIPTAEECARMECDCTTFCVRRKR